VIIKNRNKFAYVATLPCKAVITGNMQVVLKYKVLWLHIYGVVGLLITKLNSFIAQWGE